MTRLPETQEAPDDVHDQAANAFTEDQYRAIAWAVTVINVFNRLVVTSRKPLPPVRNNGNRLPLRGQSRQDKNAQNQQICARD